MYKLRSTLLETFRNPGLVPTRYWLDILFRKVSDVNPPTEAVFILLVFASTAPDAPNFTGQLWLGQEWCILYTTTFGSFSICMYMYVYVYICM